MSVPTLRGFLESLKSRPIQSYIQPHLNLLNVVCGNESADFDSVSSALSYAYFDYLYKQQQEKKQLHVERSTLNEKYIPLLPVINIPRGDLKLRKDIMLMLNKEYHISEDLLFFQDDLITWKSDKHLTINAVLVDHNELVNKSIELIDNVTGIVDHHVDSNLYMNANPRIVKVTGSCTSLVMNYWYNLIEDKLSMVDMIKFMHGALLLDTANFKHKVEAPDRIALNYYKQITSGLEVNTVMFNKIDFNSSENDKLFKTLKKAKKDIKGLSVSEVIRKDYKQFVFHLNGSNDDKMTVGIGSMVKSLKWLHKEYDGINRFRKECELFREGNCLDLLVIMSSYNDKTQNMFTREMGLVCSNEKKDIVLSMIDGMTPLLKLEPWRSDNDDDGGDNAYLNNREGLFAPSCFWELKQLNVEASRKQVVPIMKQVLEHL